MSGYKIKIDYRVISPDCRVFKYRTFSRAYRKALTLGHNTMIEKLYSYRWGFGALKVWYITQVHYDDNVNKKSLILQNDSRNRWTKNMIRNWKKTW